MKTVSLWLQLIVFLYIIILAYLIKIYTILKQLFKYRVKLTVIHVLLIVHRTRSFGIIKLLIVVKLPLVEVVVPLLLLCVSFTSVHWWGVEGSLVPWCWLVDVTGWCGPCQVAWGWHLCRKKICCLYFSYKTYLKFLNGTVLLLFQ